MTDSVKRTIENLNKNNMKTVFVNTKEDVLNLVKEIIPKNASVGVGGSSTLKECGIISMLQMGEYNFYDRYKDGFSQKEIDDVMRKSFAADYYLSSSNAITENGELYNVDGKGNRLAALNFGPEKVIIVAGKNKIVKDLKEADIRVKTVAAPKNTVRLNRNTPCRESGKCIALMTDNNNTFSDGCGCEDRVCRNYLILGKQRNDNRITVIICGEDLGY